MPTLSQAAEVYARLRGLEALDKPEQMALDQFIAFLGDLRVDEIQRRKVRDWISWLGQSAGRAVRPSSAASVPSRPSARR